MGSKRLKWSSDKEVIHQFSKGHARLLKKLPTQDGSADGNETAEAGGSGFVLPPDNIVPAG